MTLDYRTAFAVEPQRLEATPAEPLVLTASIVNRSPTVLNYEVRLSGLEEATVTVSPPTLILRPGEGGDVTIDAALPAFFPAGVHLAAVELLTQDVPTGIQLEGPGPETVEAVIEVEIDVQSIATARLDMPRSHLRGALGAKAEVQLHNAGTREVGFRLTGQSPEQTRSLRFRFRPPDVKVPPDTTITVPLSIASRPRPVGSPTSRAFDVVAQGPSGRLSVPGTFTHRALIPTIVFKIIAVVLILIAAVYVVRAAIRTWVVDGGDIEWVELADPDIGGGTQLTARVGHTAVWVDYPADTVEPGFIHRTIDSVTRFFTGAGDTVEGMIVWGGQGEDGLQGNGAFYRASDGQWIVVPHEGAPPARTNHTAAWTGNRMVIWGGELEDSTLVATDSGAEYDPSSRTWALLPPAPIEPRTGHTMAWTGSELVVFGGIDADGTVRDDGAMLIPPPLDVTVPDGPRSTVLSGGTWVALPPFPGPARSHHSMTWTENKGKLVVFGGYDAAGLPLGDAYTFDPTTRVWEDITRNPPAQPRACHVGLWTGARVLFIGGTASEAGETPCGDEPGLPEDPPTWTVNPVLIDVDDEIITTWEWEEPAEQPGEHFGTAFSALWTANEATIIQRVLELDTLAAVRYRPDEGTDNLPLPPEGVIGPADGFTAVWINGGIVIWGGVAEDGTLLNDGAILVLPDR